MQTLNAHLRTKSRAAGDYHLANGARLVLSSKRDCYYMTTHRGCSCKAGTYGRMCKHRKAALAGRFDDEPLIQRGGFRPTLEATLEVADWLFSLWPSYMRKVVGPKDHFLT